MILFDYEPRTPAHKAYDRYTIEWVRFKGDRAFLPAQLRDIQFEIGCYEGEPISTYSRSYVHELETMLDAEFHKSDYEYKYDETVTILQRKIYGRHCKEFVWTLKIKKKKEERRSCCV